jgi:hypothetical protein
VDWPVLLLLLLLLARLAQLVLPEPVAAATLHGPELDVQCDIERVVEAGLAMLARPCRASADAALGCALRAGTSSSKGENH